MTAIVVIVGGSNSGKTTLIEKMIPVFIHQGYRVGTIKHVMHDMSLDQKGKDSWRHARAGAEAVMVDADERVVLFKSVAGPNSVQGRLRRYVAAYFSDMDFVLAEGYKNEHLPKIEIYRQNPHTRPVCLEDEHLAAVVSDAQIHTHVPCFGLEDVALLVKFIVQMNS